MEVTQTGRARTTAASSPIPRTILDPRGARRPSAWTPSRASCSPSVPPSSAAMDSIRERSAMPVDDQRAVQVVGGKIAADAIARKDPDPEAPHLARHMSEHDAAVFELHAEHRVGQGLDPLALEFDLVLLRHVASHRSRPHLRADDSSFIKSQNYQCAVSGGCSDRQPGPAPPVPLTVVPPPREGAGDP